MQDDITFSELYSLINGTNLQSVPNGLTFTIEGYEASELSSYPRDISDEVVLAAWGLNDLNDFAQHGFSDIESYKEDLRIEYIWRKRREHVGGFGITARTWLDIEIQSHELITQLLEIYGDVIILGNGFSTLLLDLMTRNLNLNSIVVVDLFDPIITLNQLKAIIHLCLENNKRFQEDFEKAIRTFELMLVDPSIRFVTARVGRDRIEGKFDFAVTIAGPAVSREEISYLLTDTGKLITSYPRK